MRGHSYKRGSSWTVVCDEPTADDGKRRRRSKGGFATRKEAQRFLTDTLARVDSGSYAVPSKLTVTDHLEREWLPAVEGTLRPLSIQRYRSVVRLYIRPRIGSQRLQSFSGGTLNALYADLEREGLSVSTRRLVRAVLGRALRDAERWGHVPRNVARMADPPARGRSRAQAWTAGELRRFLDHVSDDRLVSLWRLAGTTGMRRGEHQETQRVDCEFAGPAYKDNDLVFADPLGGIIHPQRRTEAFSQHRKAAGILTGSLHTLRHTVATLTLTEGVRSTSWPPGSATIRASR
jgi:integrase